MSAKDKIASAIGKPIARLSRLTGGCVGDVYRVEPEDGESLVAKLDNRADACLNIEGDMLASLDKLSDFSPAPSTAPP